MKINWLVLACVSLFAAALSVGSVLLFGLGPVAGGMHGFVTGAVAAWMFRRWVFR